MFFLKTLFFFTFPSRLLYFASSSLCFVPFSICKESFIFQISIHSLSFLLFESCVLRIRSPSLYTLLLNSSVISFFFAFLIPNIFFKRKKKKSYTLFKKNKQASKQKYFTSLFKKFLFHCCVITIVKLRFRFYFGLLSCLESFLLSFNPLYNQTLYIFFLLIFLLPLYYPFNRNFQKWEKI